MVKEQYRESGLGHRISHVCFGMQSAQEVERAAHLQVRSKICICEVAFLSLIGCGQKPVQSRC